MSNRDLKYRVIDPETFVHDEVVSHDESCALFTLTHGFLEARLHVATGSVNEARGAVEPIVRAWEFESEVRTSFPVIKFEFVPALVVEQPARTPTLLHEVSDDASQLIIRSRYPHGPTIRVTPDMENIWVRYTRARLGIREPLQSAVYYGLTVIEARFGSRSKAAVALNLAPKILSQMGELSSARGDFDTARKARAASAPMTPEEARWLDHAVRHSLLQLGHIAAGLGPPEVALRDLPNLS